MIVMHPYEVARTDKFGEGACKCAVNSQVAGIVGSREIGQAHPVVHRWPERPIGETIIVLLTIERRQIHQRILNPPFVDHSGLGCRLGSYLAAPTKPETLIGSKCLLQCNAQAPRGFFARGIGNRYPVRNDDESRQRSALQDSSSRKKYSSRDCPDCPASRLRASSVGGISRPSAFAV